MFTHSALQLRRAALVACALVASVNVANVEAATVERVQRLDPYGSPFDSYYLEYTAAPGEANDLEIQLDPAGVTLHEVSRPLATKGCDQVDASTARCLSGDPLTVKLGDGDDVARIVDRRPPPTNPKSDVPRGPQVRIEAGTGTDSIAGSPGDEVFIDGGDGEADRFVGRGGEDCLSYAGRRRSVRITIGAPGEDAFTGMETLEGGSGDDVLTGDGRPNGLWGGPGKDILRGRGGDDDLDGDGGSDRLYGGSGDDALSGDTAASAVGRDWLEGGAGDDFLDLGAEDDDDSLSVAGPTFDIEADLQRDTARGGSGYDAVGYRGEADTVRGFEAETLGDTFTFARNLRRLSRTRLRLRVGVPPDQRFSEGTRILLTPRGRSGPRLSKPVRIHDEGTVTLRLTQAGVRYLRRGSAVTITSPDLINNNTVHARVVRRRSD